MYARDAKLIPMAWGPWSLNKAINTDSLGINVVVVISVGVVVLAVVVLIDADFEVNGKMFLSFTGVVSSCFKATIVLEWSSSCGVSGLFLECC